jgi:hypothetical protein
MGPHISGAKKAGVPTVVLIVVSIEGCTNSAMAKDRRPRLCLTEHQLQAPMELPWLWHRPLPLDQVAVLS